MTNQPGNLIWNYMRSREGPMATRRAGAGKQFDTSRCDISGPAPDFSASQYFAQQVALLTRAYGYRGYSRQVNGVALHLGDPGGTGRGWYSHQQNYSPTGALFRQLDFARTGNGNLRVCQATATFDHITSITEARGVLDESEPEDDGLKSVPANTSANPNLSVKSIFPERSGMTFLFYTFGAAAAAFDVAAGTPLRVPSATDVINNML